MFKNIESQRKERYLLTCAHYNDTDQPAHPRSLWRSLPCPHGETLHPWLSKMRPVNIQIRLREGSASVTARLCLCVCGFICDISIIVIYFSSLLLFMPRKGCTARLASRKHTFIVLTHLNPTFIYSQTVLSKHLRESQTVVA